MMRKLIFISLIIGFSLSACHFLCYAEDVSSAELINNARQYDGKVVLYKGEVIGDIMMRKEFVWINVNDGINAIGIWSNKDLVKDIVYTGNYKSRGDVVEVRGVFHRACLEHGGDLDIHIDELRKINSGVVIKEKPDIAKRNQAFVLLGILGLALLLSQLKKEKHK
ncbi:MAG: DNA-binding protein [Candidatus Omnitrophota bacterium]